VRHTNPQTHKPSILIHKAYNLTRNPCTRNLEFAKAILFITEGLEMLGLPLRADKKRGHVSMLGLIFTTITIQIQRKQIKMGDTSAWEVFN
jgi:hypothetical protein